ncbi:hypothetical protein Ciccas_001496 [Cichlidogyrus casuarinus]|uniref:Alkaline phosphatase, tissue-nonspecific isozyme n=1 Tax=Cichlidogyrus casuarinus TaxID=1844966 RepID=A0ABD2QK71_9PLAT
MSKAAASNLIKIGDAIEALNTQLNDGKNLVVVSGVHGQSFTFGGTLDRRNSIYSLENLPRSATKELVPGLFYSSGPTGLMHKERQNIERDHMDSLDYQVEALVPTEEALIGMEYVPVLANGPLAELFGGVRDNTFLAHTVNLISCIGEAAKYDNVCSGINYARQNHSHLIWLICSALIVLRWVNRY